MKARLYLQSGNVDSSPSTGQMGLASVLQQVDCGLKTGQSSRFSLQGARVEQLIEH